MVRGAPAVELLGEARRRPARATGPAGAQSFVRSRASSAATLHHSAHAAAALPPAPEARGRPGRAGHTVHAAGAWAAPHATRPRLLFRCCARPTSLACSPPLSCLFPYASPCGIFSPRPSHVSSPTRPPAVFSLALSLFSPPPNSNPPPLPTVAPTHVPTVHYLCYTCVVAKPVRVVAPRPREARRAAPAALRQPRGRAGLMTRFMRVCA